MSKETDIHWFKLVPKVEIHLHLEGAIPHEALWELVQKYGGDPSVPSLESLNRRFEYRDFPHFIDTWVWKNNFLREYEDFTFLAGSVARDLASQNIRYVEAFFSPGDFARHGLQPQRLTEAIRAGLTQVPEIEISLVADLVRDFGPQKAAVTLAELAEVKDLGVVGVGIGGSEQSFPPELFEAVYEQARRLGFRTSAHAGEAAGADSVWGALRSLRVDRIGHGTRSEEDPALLDVLAEQHTPLEMCPISNIRTGVVSSLKEHPIRRYFERGLVVTVNTDDPKMFGNSLAEEFWRLESELGFSHDDIRALTLNGLQASWLPESRKQALAKAFQADPAWGGQRPGLVISAYQAAYPDHVIVHAGEELAVGKKDSEWSGWIWCTTQSGQSRWVPEQYIERKGNTWIALREYDASELTVHVGEKVTLGQVESGWVWCTNLGGQSGWVPKDNIEDIRDMA